MSLRRFDAAELKRFLVALDEALQIRVQVIVIGGSALALGYGVAAATSDVDTYETRTELLHEAAMVARNVTGLNVPIANSGVAQLPPDYEDRLVPVLPELARLEIRVLDAYDLAASKLLRGNEHDRQQLRELHDAVSLDLATLAARFDALLAGYVGDPSEPRWSFFHFVEEVWGELAALDFDPRSTR
jgi:hypothetical protein